MGKRYESIYINSNFFDGFWDNKETRYLEINEIKDILYEKLDNNEIENILNGEKNAEISGNREIMSNFKLVFEGIGLFCLSILNLIWYIVRLISVIIVAGYLSTKWGLIGQYWWCVSIVIFCVLSKFMFYNFNEDTLKDKVEEYSKKTEEYES